MPDQVLPKDPVMLLSVVNLKLRDQYASLNALCEDMAVEKEALCQKLGMLDYFYDEGSNQFK